MELKEPGGGLRIWFGSPDVQVDGNAPRATTAADDLIGRRVKIRAVKAHGSARFLDGLTGTVIAAHPIASGWVKLDLDENSRTPHRDWSVAADRLVLITPEPAGES